MPRVKDLTEGDLGSIQKYEGVTQGTMNKIERAIAAKKKVRLSEPIPGDKKPTFLVVTIDGDVVIAVRKYV